MAKEKYRKLLFAVIEMQKLGTELIGKLSVELEKGTNIDCNVAFTNIIKKQEATIADLNAMKYNCNKSKIYDVSKSPIVLRNLINIETIDKTLQNDILFSLDGFPVSKFGKKRVKCGQCGKNCKEEDYCCNKCKCNNCFNCNGNLPVSERCTTYKCIGSCRKPYKKKKDYCCDECERCYVCSQNLPPDQQCSTYKCTDCSKLCKKEDYCCDVCEKCFSCRKQVTGEVCLTYKCTGSCGKVCKKEDFFCCKRCMRCDNCNSLLPPSQQCRAYKLRLGLEIDKLLRNLVSHLTLKTLKNFLDGYENFPDFPMVYTWKDLCDKFNDAMSAILDYMCDSKNFTNPNFAALNTMDKTVRLEKLKFILDGNSKENCDLNLLMNLKEVITEQNRNQMMEIKNDMEEIKNDMQKVIDDLKDDLKRGQDDLKRGQDDLKDGQDYLKDGQDYLKDGQDDLKDGQDDLKRGQDDLKDRQDNMLNFMTEWRAEINSNKEKQSIEEEECGKVKKNWRSINGGVVIQMNRIFEGDDEDLDVRYSKISSENDVIDGNVIINYKSSTPVESQVPYHETRVIDDTIALLKIENMENGKYVIDVKSKSQNISYKVFVESDLNRPCHELYNKGIAIPCSNTKPFWDDVDKLLSDPTLKEDSSLMLPLSKCGSTKYLKDLEQMGLKYFQRNFLQNLVCFSPFDILDDKHEKVLVESFQKVLTEKYTSRRKGVILVGPNIEYHHHLVTTKSKLVGELGNCNKRCIVIFVEEISLVLVVGIAMDRCEVEDRISSVQADVKNFINIHSHQLKEEVLSIVGIIACPTIERKELKNILPFQFSDRDDEFYNSLFICEDDLFRNDLSRNFTKWWDRIIKVFHRMGNYQTISKEFESQIFSKLIGQHMITMAIVNESLPTLSNNRHDQIQTLILNGKQLHAINSDGLRKHIVGPFGSGKTLVAQRSLKKLMVKLKKKEERSTLCYINCSSDSFVDSYINEHMNGLADEKVKFVCGSLHGLFQEHVNHHTSSSSPDLAELMKSLKLLPEEFPNPHFICDEVQCSVMTEDVAKTIDEYLQTYFLHSHVVFIQQSIKKKREYQQHSIEADNFHLINGLEVHRLQNVMRVTLEIQKLIDAAQKVIRSHTMKVAVSNSNGIKASTAATMSSSSFPKVEDPLNPTSIEDLPEDRNASHPYVPGKMSVTEESSNVYIEDLDMALKFRSLSPKNETNQNTLSTDIDFFNGKPGHKISSDEKPKLIYLPNIDVNDASMIATLSFIFNNLCFKNTNPVFIGYSLQLTRLLNYGAKSCKKDTVIYIPCLQPINLQPTKEQVMGRNLDTSVLVTDHKSFLGMENEAVVTLVDPTETIMRHSIVEIISRCTNHLYIFAFAKKKECESGSMGEILDQWVTDGLVYEMDVTLNADDDDRGDITFEGKKITVYTQSENFISVSNENRLSDDEFKENSTEGIRIPLFEKIEEIDTVKYEKPSPSDEDNQPGSDEDNEPEAQNQMTDVRKNVDDLTNKFEDLQSNKTEAQNQMTDVRKKVDDLTNKFEAIKTENILTSKADVSGELKGLENFFRLSSLLHTGIKQSLLAILHNDQNDPSYTGLPRDPMNLYIELITIHRAAIIALKSRRILSQAQYDMLLPNSGTTDSNNFNLILIVILIINLTGIPPPATGWNQRMLPATDNSKAANVIRAREWRNFISHTEPNSIDSATFAMKWAEGVAIINQLGYNFDAKKLLNSPLDPTTSQQRKY